MAGAVGAFWAGDRLTLPGADVAGWAGQRAGDPSGAPPCGAGTRGLAVEPRRTGITLFLAG